MEAVQYNKAAAKPTLKSLMEIIYNLALISIGCIVFVIGMNGLLVPHKFLNAGVIGISMLVHYMVPSWEIGLVNLILNIPIVIVGWRNISRRFMMYSIYGIFFFTFAASTIQITAINVHNTMLAAIFAGVICGAANGVILRSAGSAGGMDIMSIYLNKKFGLQIGSVTFGINAVILIAGAFFYDIETLLYSIIYLFVSGHTINAVLTGFNKKKAMLVISDKSESIAEKILADKGRGVTYLKGEGAFSGYDKKVIFTITSLTELAKMKTLVLSIDPDAFIVINDTLEVLGKRHGHGRVY